MRHRIVRVYADPYQAMEMLQSLQRKIGATVVQEFPQTVANTTVMGEELYSLIKDKNLLAYPDSDMRSHVTNATGIKTVRGFRIAKEKASKKIDLAVALAMACCAALQAGKPLNNPHALPMGVGTGIGTEIKRALGSTLGQALPDTFGPAPDEQRPGKGGAWLYSGGWAGVIEEAHDDDIAQTERSRKFPSRD